MKTCCSAQCIDCQTISYANKSVQDATSAFQDFLAQEHWVCQHMLAFSYSSSPQTLCESIRCTDSIVLTAPTRLGDHMLEAHTNIRRSSAYVMANALHNVVGSLEMKQVCTRIALDWTLATILLIFAIHFKFSSTCTLTVSTHCTTWWPTMCTLASASFGPLPRQPTKVSEHFADEINRCHQVKTFLNCCYFTTTCIDTDVEL